MADWSNALCEALDAKESGLAAALHLEPGMSAMDFERALGELLRWKQVLYLEERFEGLGGSHPGHVLGEVRTARQKIMSRMTTITHVLNESLYDQFGMGRVSDDAATAAYRALLDVLEGPDDVVIATTNYDRSAEAGIRGLGLRPNTGFVSASERSPTLDPNGLVERYATEPEVVPVLHLHGAVGWYQKGGHVYDWYGDQPFNPTLGAPVVLYPDPDKDPTSDAAVDMLWREFRTALQLADRVLVLGHSLNDPALVRELQALPKVGVTAREGTDDSWVRQRVPNAIVIEAAFGPTPGFAGAGVKALLR